MEEAQLKLAPEGQKGVAQVGAGGGRVAEETTPCAGPVGPEHLMR